MNKYFFKMFSFAQPYKFSYAIGLLFYGWQTFIFPFISSLFMSMVTAAIMAGDSAEILHAGLVMLGLYAAAMALTGIGTYFYVIDVSKIRRDLFKRVFRAYVHRSVEESVAGHSAEGIASMNTEADRAIDVLSNSLSPVLQCVIAIVFSGITVFAIDYRLGLASLAAGALAFFAQSRFARPLMKLGKKQLDANVEAVKAVSDTFSGAITIRVFNMQDIALTGFDKESTKLLTISLKRAFISVWQNLFTTMQGWTTLVIVFALGGWLVATEQLNFASLMMTPGMCMAISQSISAIGSAWADLQAPITAAERVLKVLENENSENAKHDDDIRDRATVDVVSHDSDDSCECLPECSGKYSLRICGLNFKYSGTEEYALKNINLDIKENEMIAFVGASGSGKSTLLRAIAGMYRRDDFDITMGGANDTHALHIAECSPEKWRSWFAYVDQSCKLFDMTVAENIALGAGGDASDELIRYCAAQADADAFIRELPNGYDTPCGEKGASLSGGQKQRIAIARALCRKAPVLVFDEATSALDADSEKSIMKTIESLRTYHTILIATHNLHTIANAEKIVVLERGRITETGTHKELLANSGIYCSLLNRLG